MSKIRFVIYARVSTELEGQESSYDIQVTDLKDAFIELNNDKKKKIEYECVGVYADKGISGTKGKESRPQFKEMLEDAKEGKFDLVVTKNLSRLARNTQILLETLKELQECNVDLFIQEEKIDTREAQNKFYITVLAALADMEAENLRSHIQEGFAIKRANHQPARPSAICLGYKLVKNPKTGRSDVEPDDEQAELVKRIFRMFVEDNISAGTIARRLNIEGVEGPRKHKSKSKKGAKNWHRSSIKYILKNEKYIGKVVEHKLENKKIVDTYKFDNAYPPIIEKTIFDKAQEIMKARETSEKAEKMRANRRNFTPQLYPLSGLCFCSVCGDKCTRFSHHADHHKRTYLEEPCNGNPLWGCMGSGLGKKHPQHCENYRISEHYLYRMIIDAIVIALYEKNLIADYADQINVWHKEEVDYEKAQKSYEKALSEQKAKLKRLIDLRVEGTIDISDFNARKARIERETKRIMMSEPTPPEIDRSNLEKAINLLSNRDVRLASSENKYYLTRLFMDPDSRRAIVRALVERIDIGMDPEYEKLFEEFYEGESPGYRATIKLYGCSPIEFAASRRSPYRRKMRNAETGELEDVLVEDEYFPTTYYSDDEPEVYIGQ